MELLLGLFVGLLVLTIVFGPWIVFSRLNQRLNEQIRDSEQRFGSLTLRLHQLEEALRTLRENPAAVSLLVTNQPHYFIDFANTLPLIYDAAFPDPELAQRFSCCRTLRKPFRPCELVSCADELAGREPRLTRQ